MTELRRVLIVEDDPIVRLDVRSMLERNGIEVAGEARGGEEAVALAQELGDGLNAVIMDVNMDGLDGLEAARRIRKERPVPIVIVTGYGQQELVSRAASAGVFAYLTKPFKERDLVTAVEIAIARHDELQELAGFRQEVELAESGKLFPSHLKW